MKRILGITTAALMSASVLAAPAFAQESPVPVPGADSGQTTMPDIDTDTTAAIGANFDGALAAIGNNTASAQSIGAMSDVQTVRVVRIGDLEGSSPALVEQAVSQNSEGVQDLRASVAANPGLSQQLEAQGVDVLSVIGADVGAMGEVTVYVM